MAGAPMCKKILFVTIIVFLAQMFFTRPATVADLQYEIDQIQLEFEADELEEAGEHFDADFFVRSAPQISTVQKWLELDTDKVLKKGQIWRLITSAFCHDRLGIWHIVFNMLFLFWFGQFVESTYGSKEFLCFYLVAAAVASFAFIGLELFTGD